MLEYPGICNLAAQKHYVSLYIRSAVLAKHRSLLKGISTGKCCMRFKKLQHVNQDGLRKIFQDLK